MFKGWAANHDWKRRKTLRQWWHSKRGEVPSVLVDKEESVYLAGRTEIQSWNGTAYTPWTLKASRGWSTRVSGGTLGGEQAGITQHRVKDQAHTFKGFTFREVRTCGGGLQKSDLQTRVYAAAGGGERRESWEDGHSGISLLCLFIPSCFREDLMKAVKGL